MKSLLLRLSALTVLILLILVSVSCGDETTTEKGTSPFSELKYVAFGDSITYGEVASTGTQMEKPYPNLVAEELGLKAVRNYGERNATVKVPSTTSNKPNIFTKVNEASATADIVSVMIGINDFGAGCALGTMQDTSCTESVYGGFNQLASSLKQYLLH